MKKIPAELTGKQRKFLRGAAHHLEPLVRIGREGVSLGIADALSEVLETHELVKVKLLENAPVTRAEAADELANVCGAHVVGQIGRIVIFYRRHPSEPEIRLPR